MDGIRTLSDRVLLSFGLSSDSDKSKDEERIPEVIGKCAGSGSPALAVASNTGIDSQAVDNCSSEDESDVTFSMASEVPYQGQGNFAPEGAVSPNPLNEVVNPTSSSNGKPIVKEESRSKSLNLRKSMSGRSELNQPINPYPTMNKSFPAGIGTEGYYRIIDNAFSPSSEHDMNTAFITNSHECDRIRERAYQRDMLECQQMSEELHRDSYFGDGQDRDSYNTYLHSETNRLAIQSRHRHLEKLERECHSRWFLNNRKDETSNSVLDDRISDCAPFPRSEPVDSSSNSLLESYRASMEEARLSIKYKEEEISNLKREKENYALKSEDNFRKSEQRFREKEDEIAHMWNRLETMQSYQLDMIAQKRVSNATGRQPRNKDDHIPVNEDTFSECIKVHQNTYEKS